MQCWNFPVKTLIAWSQKALSDLHRLQHSYHDHAIEKHLIYSLCFPSQSTHLCSQDVLMQMLSISSQELWSAMGCSKDHSKALWTQACVCASPPLAMISLFSVNCLLNFVHVISLWRGKLTLWRKRTLFVLYLIATILFPDTMQSHISKIVSWLPYQEPWIRIPLQFFFLNDFPNDSEAEWNLRIIDLENISTKMLSNITDPLKFCVSLRCS